LSVSSLNHSCNPNCAIIFDGISACVRVIRDFEENEQASISYTEILMTRDQRKNYLKAHYYFDCCCTRCSASNEIDAKMTGLSCAYCAEYRFQLSEASQTDDNAECELGVCKNCGKSNKSRIQKANLCVSEIQLLFNKASSFKLIESYKSLANKLDQAFVIEAKNVTSAPIENMFAIKFYEAYMELLIASNEFSFAVQIAVKYLVNAYDLYLPECHPTKSLMYLKIAKIFSNLYELDKAREYYTKANAIISKTHETTHPLCQEMRLLYLQLNEQ